MYTQVRSRECKSETHKAITFSYNLSNSVQTFRVISHFELDVNKENRDSAKSLEEVLDATLRTNATVDRSSGLFLSMEVNC
jgi:hypothetical protein